MSTSAALRSASRSLRLLHTSPSLRCGSRTVMLLPPEWSEDSSRCELLNRGRSATPIWTVLALALLFLWIPSRIAAQTPPPGATGVAGADTGAGLPADAAAALARAASRYSDGSAHSALFVQIYTPAGFTTAKRESGTLWIQAPQKLRFDYQAPEKKTFTYAAGEGRLFTPEDKQLTIQKLSAEDRARLPIVFLSDPTELGREYSVSAEAGDGGAARLLLRPRTPRPDLGWLRLAIGRDGGVSELAYEDGSGNRTEFRFEGWHAQKPRPAGDYQIAGPKGTRIVEN